VGKAPFVEPGSDLLARADRHGRLHDEDRPPVQLGQFVDHRPDTRQVGVARVRRRRVDAHEEKLAADQVVHIERERQPVGVALEQLRHVLFVERDAAVLKRLDLVRHDVADHDLVPELGEAGAGDQADPARSEDPDLCAPCHRRRNLLRAC
jgi:hypothetical protein